MIQKKIIEQKESWNKLAWNWGKDITTPARPCHNLLKIWEEIVKKISRKIKNPKALILGATPELRDLVIKYNFESNACDINPNMLEAMDKLMKYKKHPKNKKIIANWLELKLSENTFDIILGHLVLEQILSKKDLKKLLNKLKNLLKPTGFFLICVLVKEKKKAEIVGNKWTEWIERYKNKEISNSELYLFLKYYSDWNPFFKSPAVVGTADLFQKLSRLYKQGKIPRSFYQWWERSLGSKDKPAFIFLRKDLERLLEEYFQLILINQCYEFRFCEHMPSYLGKPKKK